MYWRIDDRGNLHPLGADEPPDWSQGRSLAEGPYLLPRRTIYAAVTRARSHLVIVGDPDLSDEYGFRKVAERLASPA